MLSFLWSLAALSITAMAVPMEKRSYSGTATNFEPGTGSCGATSSDSDFIVAMNLAQMSSSLCFSSISITANGKTATATVVDTCMGCGYGDLDMSPGLFSYFADINAGVITVSWDFGGASDSNSDTTSAAAYTPTTTSNTPAPTTTSTYVWVDPSPWTSMTSSSTPAAVVANIVVSTTSSSVLPTSTTPTSTYVAPSTSSSATSSTSSLISSKAAVSAVRASASASVTVSGSVSAVPSQSGDAAASDISASGQDNTSTSTTATSTTGGLNSLMSVLLALGDGVSVVLSS